MRIAPPLSAVVLYEGGNLFQEKRGALCLSQTSFVNVYCLSALIGNRALFYIIIALLIRLENQAVSLMQNRKKRKLLQQNLEIYKKLGKANLKFIQTMLFYEISPR